MQGRVFIIDDEKLTRATLEMQLSDEGFAVTTANNGFEAIAALEREPYDVVITDLRMPSMDGLEFLRRAHERWPDIAVVFITAYGTVSTAVQAMREGAADYLTKPLNAEDLSIRVRRLVERRREQQEIKALREQAAQHQRVRELIYHSEAMRDVVERALAIADSDATVLVTGETGTGKGVLARIIHEHSARKSAALVTVNCGELNANLVESELFGHEAGAFTSASRRRQGRFEIADHGTLFIDEADDLPLEIQMRLLRFLQDRTYERVGSSKTLRADVRVICATKSSLDELVSSGRFREDLYYRLNTITISLPPLRERRVDVLPLSEFFIERHCKPERAGTIKLLPETEALLVAHDWPGNVRELEHVIEHAVTFCRGEPIAARHLPLSLTQGHTNDSVVSLDLEGRSGVAYESVVAECESALLDWALAKTGGNQAQAAKLLDLSRTTLRGRLAALQKLPTDNGSDQSSR